MTKENGNSSSEVFVGELAFEIKWQTLPNLEPDLL